MSTIKPLTLLFLLAFGLQAQSNSMYYVPTGNPFPVWQKITVANSGASFTVTCVPATANCGNTVAKTAGTTQSVVLYVLPANGYIVGCPQIKSTTAFTGSFVTLTGTLGTTQSGTFYTTGLYDLMAAVSATNFSPLTGLCAGTGSTTRSATNLTLNLISTVDNISTTATGAVEIQFLITVMP